MYSYTDAPAAEGAAPRAGVADALLSALKRARGPSARKELPDFTRQLATLLGANITEPSALETLRPGVQSPELRGVVESLEIATKRGMKLSAALRKHPSVFDRVYVEIVAAGERAGMLAHMLDPLATSLVDADKVRKRVNRALIGPVFQLSATVVGAWYVVQNVVPTFSSLYQREGVELPRSTRALLWVADVVGATGNLLPIAFAATLLLMPAVLRRPAVRSAVDSIILHLPIAGRVARLRAVASFVRFFAILLATQTVQEVEAIGLAARTAPNSAAAAKLAAAANDVASGTTKVAGALMRTGVVPESVVQIIRSGEKSGQLAGLMQYTSTRLHDQLLEQIEQAQAAVDPIALCITFSVVAFVIIALYSPMAGLYEVMMQ